MPKQSAEPHRYIINSDYFALERAELSQKREFMLVKHAQELEEFERQYDRLGQLEADIAELAERHAKPLSKKKIILDEKSKAKRSTPSRPVPSGKPWTPEEDARVLAADDAGLHALAAERNTTFSAIKAHRSVLLRRRAEAAERAVDEVLTGAEQSEPSSSENPEIVEPTSAFVELRYTMPKPAPSPATVVESEVRPTEGARAARPASSIFDDHRATERKPPERGTPVRGIMENGPEDRREYGHGFESVGRE